MSATSEPSRPLSAWDGAAMSKEQLAQVVNNFRSGADLSWNVYPEPATRQLTSQERHPEGRWSGRFDAWRDVDSTRKKFGLVVWAWGAELRLGKRLYRCRVHKREWTWTA